MKHLDLFSGIGGFALAADRVFGKVEHIFCEIDLFCQAVLRKHYPNSKIYGDIRELIAYAEYERPHNSQNKQELESKRSNKLRFEQSRSMGQIDLLTGGFPCQPFSNAGRRRGTQDDRYLWGEMFRVIQLTKPKWVIAENVHGLLTIEQGVVFQKCISDLEGEDYAVQTFIIPACAVNAPHRRDRIWVAANRDNARSGAPGRKSFSHGTANSKEWEHAQRRANGQDSDVADSPFFNEERGQRKGNGGGRPERSDRNTNWDEDWFEVATRLCTLDDGLSNELVRPRGWRNAALKAVGNAIVPQVAEEIMRAIKYADSD